MCTCIATVNAKLEEHNAGINCTLFGTPQRVTVETYKLDSRKRGRPPVMTASYCPFCGEHYGKEGGSE